MLKKSKQSLIMAASLFLLFIIFTVMVKTIDVRPIGPEQSSVGFASVNKFVFELFGVNPLWYNVSEWMGAAAMATAFGFAMAGLFQLVTRRSIRKVDVPILVLGAFYGILAACYVFFEVVVINYRPVILTQGSVLEASFPSSHTMASICIMATAMIEFHDYLRKRRGWLMAADTAAVLILVLTVVGRMLSGVHWFTDIVAGVILSAALIALFCLALQYTEERSGRAGTADSRK